MRSRVRIPLVVVGGQPALSGYPGLVGGPSGPEGYRGKLATQPIASRDAATLQSAENVVLGETPKGSPAAVMQSAADLNRQQGAVERDEMSSAVMEQGATVTEADVGGYRIITESVGGQVVAQYGRPTEVKMKEPAKAMEQDAITIGEALEATTLAAGDKPIDQGDAAAIQAAEVRATGLANVVPGGVGAEAQSAATHNARTEMEEEKIKLGDVLVDAAAKLTDDKPVTMEVAKGVVSAEIRNKPDMTTYPGGVAATVAAAAKLNQK